jgi:hypothetical protein
MPNYTPEGWWEADVWAWYPSGRTTEFEIKLTKSDFLADLQKKDLGGTFKHAKLQLGHTMGPNRFLYVIPEKLEEVVVPVLPEYAGLLIVSDRGILHEVKKPPVLHSMTSERPVKDTNVSLYHRYWQLKGKVGKATCEPSMNLDLEGLVKTGKRLSMLPQLMLLMALKEREGPISHIELGDICRLTSGTVKSTAKRLEDSGLLVRKPIEGTSSFCYEITLEGSEFMHDAEKH